MGSDDSTRHRRDRIRQGGAPKYHAKNAEVGKLFARERLARLLDAHDRQHDRDDTDRHIDEEDPAP